MGESNRGARRAEIAKLKKRSKFKMPAVPNISGTDEACRNCRWCADPEVLIDVRDAQRIEAPLPKEHATCMLTPSHMDRTTWWWCSRWTSKTKADTSKSDEP